MPSIESSISLDEETISDLLYFARAADLQDLKESVTQLAKSQHVRELDILAAAVDADSGNLCSHFAAANGHYDVIEYIASLGSLATPVDQISILARQNISGNTPLHWAALNGHLNVVKHVVQSLPKDAQAVLVTCKNNAGHDAAFEAESNNKTDVVSYLLGVLDETDSLRPAADGSGERTDDFEEAVDESVSVGSANPGSDAQVEDLERRLDETELRDDQNT